nr:cob(I)yrinic acid a,c-diamide adenosyltransferase [uncultured Blautia sp.]
MERELTEVYCGNGKGKTALAIGQSLREATQGKSVIVIQFLKGRERRSLDFLQELMNLDFKIFRFEKQDCCYAELTEEEKKEENVNILNGVNFARKVIVTQECDFLLLDEILGLVDKGIVTVDTVADILKQKDESMHIVMTGWNLPEELRPYVDVITTLNTEEINADSVKGE